MPYAVPDEVAERIDAASRESKALHAARKLASRDFDQVTRALEAFAPGAKSPDDLPADYMPRWLACVIHTLDNELDDRNIPAFLRNLAERSRRWRNLSDSAWRRIRDQLLYDCVREALNLAGARQPSPAPRYWRDVEGAGEVVLAALLSEEGLPDAATVADRELWKWSAEAIGSDPSKDEAPNDAVLSAKAAMETIASAARAALNDSHSSLAAAATVDSAGDAAGTPVSDEAKTVRWTLAWRLFGLLDREIAAAP